MSSGGGTASSAVTSAAFGTRSTVTVSHELSTVTIARARTVNPSTIQTCKLLHCRDMMQDKMPVSFGAMLKKREISLCTTLSTDAADQTNNQNRSQALYAELITEIALE